MSNQILKPVDSSKIHPPTTRPTSARTATTSAAPSTA
jgi:hypothetical protein